MELIDIRNKIDRHTFEHAFGFAAFILVDELLEFLEKRKLLSRTEVGYVTTNAYNRTIGLADEYRKQEGRENDANLFERAASAVAFVADRLQRSSGVE